MFSFLGLTTLFAYFGMNGEILFYIMGFVGIILIVLIFKRHGIMSLWTLISLILSIRFKFKYEGLQNLPENGAILLLGNHVSWIDWYCLQLPIKRRINFMMDKDIYNYKFLTPVLKKGKVIPISSKSFKDGFKDASARLKNENIVAIYPEGEISRDGKLSKFQRGYELLQTNHSGVTIPYFIDGMFGSIFSKCKMNQKKYFFKRREVTVKFLPQIPNTTKADKLQNIIQNMKDNN